MEAVVERVGANGDPEQRSTHIALGGAGWAQGDGNSPCRIRKVLDFISPERAPEDVAPAVGVGVAKSCNTLNIRIVSSLRLASPTRCPTCLTGTGRSSRAELAPRCGRAGKPRRGGIRCRASRDAINFAPKTAALKAVPPPSDRPRDPRLRPGPLRRTHPRPISPCASGRSAGSCPQTWCRSSRYPR